MGFEKVTLPNGFVRDRVWRHEVWARGWTGADALALGEPPGAGTPPSRRSTAILARCASVDGTDPAGSDWARSLTVGDREALLLHVYRMGTGRALDVVIDCSSCGEMMDLRLDVNRLLVEPSVHDAPAHRCVIDRGSGRYDVVFHLPTGADQEDVVDEAIADPEAAARRLLIRCIETVNGVETSEIPATAAAGLPAIMAGIDTQAEVMLDATCPACGSAVSALFDAGTFVHREIDRTWRDIHREVHLLASHYHWSEEEILRLGSSKRRLYLDFVEEAVRSSS